MTHLLCWLGSHKWIPKKTKYPICVFWRDGIEDGTAVYEKCRCGNARVREIIWKWVIFKGALVNII